MREAFKTVLIVIVGFLLGIGFQAFANPTSVRVGPTAAIGIATSGDGSIVYVANGSGIYRSKDSGGNWEKVY